MYLISLDNCVPPSYSGPAFLFLLLLFFLWATVHSVSYCPVSMHVHVLLDVWSGWFPASFRGDQKRFHLFWIFWGLLCGVAYGPPRVCSVYWEKNVYSTSQSLPTYETCLKMLSNGSMPWEGKEYWTPSFCSSVLILKDFDKYLFVKIPPVLWDCWNLRSQFW